MKAGITIITSSGLFIGLVFTTALAIEPPPDDARPPAALLNNADKTPRARAPENTAPRIIPPVQEAMESVPFIGLATAALPDMVAAHLDLAPGIGVIVRTVAPGSPAEKAGLSVNDIILEIDGTKIGNPEALTSVVRDHKPGDRVALQLIHKGKPSRVEVTLSERPADLSAFENPDPMLEGLPQEHADRLRGMIEKNLGAFGGEAAFPDENMDEAFRTMRERMFRSLGQQMIQPPLENPGETGIQQNSTIRVMDGQGSIEIRSSGENTEATVSDANNETIWSGPWNTEEDKAAAPKDIRERIEKVHRGNGKGFTFRFGKPRPGTIDN